MKIATVVGARPQFIKAAMVSRLVQTHRDIQELLIHTGQHYDENMSNVFFNELSIPYPNINLGIGSGTHGAQTGRMLEALEKAFVDIRPDWVLVYGDTNSTLAAALAAAKLHIKVAHVEAGLRSFNRLMPEEINRILTDQVADLLFAPTETAVQHLQREGFKEERIHLVGDVMYDAALYYGAKSDITSQILTKLQLQPQNYILATIHRAENTDDPLRLKTVFTALAELSTHLPLVLPLHPRTRAALEQGGLHEVLSPAMQIIDPLGYLDMIMLEKNASLIVTDSGGIQKEAYFYRVPCVTLRNETEWVETVELGWNVVCPPTDVVSIVQGALSQLTRQGREYASPYGNGTAAVEIIDRLRQNVSSVIT